MQQVRHLISQEKMTDTIEKAINELENPQIDPIPVIEVLAAEKQQSAPQLISQLEHSRPEKTTSRIARLVELFSRARRLQLIKNRRIIIALGAMRAKKAIPTLLGVITYPFDITLGRAVSWSMANMGDEAIGPLFHLSRSRQALVSARILAITTLGYIQDPRVPAVLHGLWTQYRREVPDLVIATLTSLILHGQVQEARKLAMDTESLWHFQGDQDEYLENYWDNLIFENSIEKLKSTLEQVKPVKKLPNWPVVMRNLESA